MSDSKQQYVDASRAILTRLKDVNVPEGHVKDTMGNEYHRDGKGLGTALYALAEFVAAKQEGPAIEANKEMLRRLHGDDKNDLFISDHKKIEPLAATILEVAMADGEDLTNKARLLNNTLRMRDGDLFDQLRLAIKNIARDHKIMLQDTTRGDDPPKDRMIRQSALKMRKKKRKIRGRGVNLSVKPMTLTRKV